MNAGEQVFHRQLGWGTVKKILQNGHRLGAWVDFGYTKEFLKVEELQTVDQMEKRPAARKAVAEKAEKTKPDARFGAGDDWKSAQAAGARQKKESCPVEARKGIVALRLGQILESQVSQLSVGTGRLESILKAEVEKATGQKPAFVLVEGVWGGGKTHALTLLQALSRQAGFTTSAVVMDGMGMSLSEPMQLMEEILSSLVFPRPLGILNLGELMRSVVKGGKIPSVRVKGAPTWLDSWENCLWPLSTIPRHSASFRIIFRFRFPLRKPSRGSSCLGSTLHYCRPSGCPKWRIAHTLFAFLYETGPICYPPPGLEDCCSSWMNSMWSMHRRRSAICLLPSARGAASTFCSK